MAGRVGEEGERGKAKTIGGGGYGVGVNFWLAGNRLASWKPFEPTAPLTPSPPPIQKIDICESMSC